MFLVTADRAVVVDISELLQGPLFDALFAQLASALDDRLAEHVEAGYLSPQHTYEVEAVATIRLKYESDEPVNLELNLPDDTVLLSGGGDACSVRIDQIPALIDRLQRLYHDTDPEDYSHWVDVRRLLWSVRE